MTTEQKKDFTLRISQANPVSMITLLYELALCYIREAKGQQREEYAQAVHQAQAVIRELQHSLQLEYEPAPALLELYLYMHQQLQQAIWKKEPALLEQPERILERLHGAYVELEKTGNWGSVMTNTQQVYAGLTYGKYALNENVDDTANRGFRV